MGRRDSAAMERRGARQGLAGSREARVNGAPARSLLDTKAEGGLAWDGPDAEVRVGGCTYRILRRLGAGGMGVVWLAEEVALRRRVALKTLAPHIAENPEAVARFLAEARAACRLQHPGIVQVLAVHGDGPERIIAMEWIPGPSLATVITELQGVTDAAISEGALEQTLRRLGSAMADGPGSPHHPLYRWVARCGLEAATALDHAHARGVRHRDVKPGNLLLDETGAVRLVDFGLARIEEGSALTRTGMLLGTPAYSSPEALGALSAPLDARTDVYSLGAVLFELTCQRPPRNARSVPDLVEDLRRRPAPLVSRHRPGVPAPLEAIIACCLRLHPADRYATAADLAADLQAFLDDRPVRARHAGVATRLREAARRRPLLTAIGASALVAAAILPGWLHRRSQEADLRAIADACALVSTSIVQAEEASERATSERANLRSAREAAIAAPDAASARLAHDLIAENLASAEDDVVRALGRAVEVLESASALPTEATVQRAAELRAAWIRLHRATADHGLRWLDRSCAQRLGDPRARDLLAPDSDGRGDVEVIGAPPGAELHLFRYVPEFGRLPPHRATGRLVPWPVDPATGRLLEEAGVESLVGSECLVVTSTAAGGAAAREGVRPGDLVIAIDGEATGFGAWLAEVDPAGRGARQGARAWLPVAAAGNGYPRHLDDWKRTAEGPLDGGLPVRFGARGPVVQFAAKERIDDVLGARVVDAPSLLLRERPTTTVPVEVWGRGGRRRVDVRPGEEFGAGAERTALPVPLLSACALGTGRRLSLPAGSYLIVAAAAGRHGARFPFTVRRDATRVLDIDLPAEGTAPPGYVWVPPGESAPPPTMEEFHSVPRPRRGQEHRVDGFWIARTEVTIAEWIEFVEHVARARGLDAATPLLVRHVEEVHTLGTISADGRITPTGPTPDAPATGVRQVDAGEYLGYLTARLRAAGFRVRAELPTTAQWRRAASGADGRLFPWGDGWDDGYCLNSMTRGSLLREEAPPAFEMRDESPFGVRDMAGSRREWTEAGIAGGSFADNVQRLFACNSVEGISPETRNWSFGLRVVLIPEE